MRPGIFLRRLTCGIIYLRVRVSALLCDKGIKLETTLEASPALQERLLEKEGSVLFQYLLGQVADAETLHLYVDAVTKQTSNDRPLHLPPLVEWWPPLLRLFEPVKGGREGRGVGLLKQRLRMVCFIADAEKAPLFYDYEGRELVASWIRLAALAFVEGVIMPFRLVLGRLWHW